MNCTVASYRIIPMLVLGMLTLCGAISAADISFKDIAGAQEIAVDSNRVGEFAPLVTDRALTER